MATTFIGKSFAPKRDKVYAYQCNTASLKEGAAMVYDTSASGQLVKAPTGAAVLGFAGLVADVLGSSGTAVGIDINLQRTGIGMGLIATGITVTVGDELVIADTAGTLRSFALGSDDDCDIVGVCETTKTAGSATESILVNLDKQRSVHKDAS